MMERPDWHPGDTLRSVVDVVTGLGGAALSATVGRLDAWLADYGDE